MDAVMQSLNDGSSVLHSNTGNPQRVTSGLWNGRIDTENIVKGCQVSCSI